jgi:hypothetical protein
MVVGWHKRSVVATHVVQSGTTYVRPDREPISGAVTRSTLAEFGAFTLWLVRSGRGTPTDQNPANTDNKPASTTPGHSEGLGWLAREVGWELRLAELRAAATPPA